MSTYYIVECARLDFPEGDTPPTSRSSCDISQPLQGRRWEGTYYEDSLGKAEERVNEIMTNDDTAVFVLLSKWEHPEDIELITGKNSTRADPQATETPIIYADRAYSVGTRLHNIVSVTMQPWCTTDFSGQTPVVGGRIQWSPRIIHYSPTTGAPLKEHRVDWTSVDWSLSDSEIARAKCVTRQTVNAQRKRHAPS